MPSKKKKYNARFPAGRIKKIMQTDEEVGKVAQAVPVIISRTLELFVESLLTKTMQITNAKNAKILSPTHMKQCILAENRFDFLKDLVKTLPDATSNDTDDGTSTQSNVLPPATTTARVYKSRTSISRRRSSEDQITSRKKRRRINSDDNKTSSSSSLVNNNLTSNEDDDEDIEDIENIDDDDDGEDSDEKHENRLTILTPNTSMDPNGELDEDYDT